MNKHFIITVDREVIKKYNKYYFKENPKARKSYFMNDWKNKRKKKNVTELYSVLSLNQLLPISPPKYSTLKKQWGDFGKWLADYYGYRNCNFGNAVVEYKVYNEINNKKDCDNVVAKILNDGLFVQSGMFEDDSYHFINPFISSMSLDRKHPRLEIRVSIIDGRIKDVYKKLKIHIANFE